MSTPRPVPPTKPVPDELLLLNAWCPMHDELDADGEPIPHTSQVRLQFVPLPADEVHDAWTCTRDDCNWFIVVAKGSTKVVHFVVHP